MRTLKTTVGVWLTDPSSSYEGVTEFVDRLKGKGNGKPESLLYFSNNDMTDQGWVKVGTANATVNIDSTNELVASAVQSLEKVLANERAAWMNKQQRILDRIANLRALPAPSSDA